MSRKQTRRRATRSKRSVTATPRGPASNAAEVEADLAAAIQHLKAGQLQHAQWLLTRVSKAQPGNPVAMHLLGVIALQAGNNETAVELIAKAVALEPEFAEAYYTLGSALMNQGKHDEAASAYQAAIARRPDYDKAYINLGIVRVNQGKLEDAISAFRKAAALTPNVAQVHNNLGSALVAQGKHGEAVASYRKAIALNPKYAEAHFNAGYALKCQGRLTDAVIHYRKAIALKPGYAGARNNLGTALKDLGKLSEAVTSYREAIALDPRDAEVHSNLGNALNDLNQLDEAVACYRQAIALKPSQAQAHTNLGGALRALDRFDEAVACHHRAIALDPLLALAHQNLGGAFMSQGKLEESLAAFDRALAIDPDCDEARFGTAWVHLLQGNFAAGWPAYLARKSMSRKDPKFHRELLAPDLSGKRVLVVKDQGLGDEIFFLRFVPLCAARGASIAYAANPKIATMIERLPFVDQMVGPDDEGGSFDLSLSVGDLPYLLGIARVIDTPPPVELSILPEREAEMRRRLHDIGPPPYIGITWRAGIQERHKFSKLFPIEWGASVLRSVGATVVVLQRYPTAGELDQFARDLGRDAHDFTALNDDLEGMLALVDLLDDYVCVTNTNLHLRVARGRTCRVLVPSPPEFRWMAEGEESPWFPGTRVYRQTVDDGWDPAFADLARDLADAWPMSQR